MLRLVVAAGSLDRTIRLWDLTYGMPLSISRPHGGTVRAVALDHTLIASGAYACGRGYDGWSPGMNVHQLQLPHQVTYAGSRGLGAWQLPYLPGVASEGLLAVCSFVMV